MLSEILTVAFGAPSHEVRGHICDGQVMLLMHGDVHCHLVVLGFSVALLVTDRAELQLVGLAHVLSADGFLLVAQDFEAALGVRLEFNLPVHLRRHILALASMRPLVQLCLHRAAAFVFVVGDGGDEVWRLLILGVRDSCPRDGSLASQSPRGNHVIGRDESMVVVVINCNGVLVGAAFW